MTTATRTRKTNALAELERLEHELLAAADEAARLGAQHWERRCKLTGRPGVDMGGLADDLNRLRLREPQHFHPNGAAVDPDSPAGELVAQVDELLSGLDDLGLEVEHARRLEERKREDLQEYVRQHFAAIVEALRPQAEQVATETNEAARVFAAQLDRYREHGSRIHGLCAIAQHYGDAPLARDIEGYDAAGEFQKVVRSIDLPAPTLPPRA